MSAPTLVAPYHLVPSTVVRIRDLSRNFRRFTFSGPRVGQLDTSGWDQRIKLILPLPGVGFDVLSYGGDWYAGWQQLPDPQRLPIRTYTVRAVRPEVAEIDVDIALHGRSGPATRWATDAVVGDELVICGPNREHGGPYGGVDFLPPAQTDLFLLAGDPTALPAIASILERLPAHSRGIAVIEVEHASDARAVGVAPDGIDVQVVVRRPGELGSALIPAVQRAAERLLEPALPCPRLEDVDIEHGLLWEAPRDEVNWQLPARESTHVYAWLAGEAGVIKLLRRHLVADRGMDRKSVAFMGYWRSGRQEQN